MAAAKAILNATGATLSVTPAPAPEVFILDFGDDWVVEEPVRRGARTPADNVALTTIQRASAFPEGVEKRERG